MMPIQRVVASGAREDSRPFSSRLSFTLSVVTLPRTIRRLLFCELDPLEGIHDYRPRLARTRWTLSEAMTKQRMIRAVFFLCLLGFWVGPSGLAARADTLIERVESPYNNIFLYRDARGRYVLTFGYRSRGYVESIVNPADELELPVVYTRSMTAALLYPEGLERAMMIGMGGGRTSWYLHRQMPALEMTAVELDPEIIRLARQYFGVQEEGNFRIVEGDGRRAVMADESRYDLIFVDAYRGPFVPFHLLTREFYSLLRDRLTEGGVVAQNIEPSTMLFESAVATMLEVFDQVDFYHAAGNVVAVAYRGPRRAEESLRARAEALQARFGFRYDLRDFLAQRRSFTPDATIEPLTDDFAPVTALKAIERHNQRWD